MSHYDYLESQKISSCDPTFAALIFAAMRKADSFNLIRLQTMFPELYQEFWDRYNSPGGQLRSEREPQRIA
jgi:hypothetical protein